MFFKNLMVAVAYFISAVIGDLVASSSVAASPIWPAAGLALAALLIYGNKVFLGLFFGVLAAQLYSFSEVFNSNNILSSVLTGCAFAVGSSMQALFGVWLIRKKHISATNPLLVDKDIFIFFFYGGIISTVVAATIGVLTLWTKSIINLDEMGGTWFMWWLGDAIGVLVFTPIIMVFFAKPREIWRQRIKTVAVPLFFIITAVLILFAYSINQDKRKVNILFETKVKQFHYALTAKIQDVFQESLVLKGIFDGSNYVSKHEFSLFSMPLLQRNSGLLSLQWSPKVIYGEKTPLKIKEFGANGLLVPVEKRNEYYPITYVEPLETNDVVLGLDILSQPHVTGLIEQLRITGETLMSPPIQLLQKKGGYGYVIYSPVFQKDNQKELKGVVSSVFQLKKLVKSVVFVKDADFYFEIKEGDKVVYRSLNNRPIYGVDSMEQNLSIDISNKHLMVNYLPTKTFIMQQQSWTIWLILLGGFLFVGFSGIGLLMLSGRTLKTEELVRQRTNELRKTKEILERQNKVLFQANEKVVQAGLAKDQFLSNMSHELRTPLNAINGFAQLLSLDDDSLSDEQMESVGYILNSGNHLLELVTDILDFAGLSANKLSIDLENTLFSELVEGCVILLKPLLLKQGIRLIIEGMESCLVLVYVDETRLKQVVINLLNNAIKYNKSSGSISVSMKTTNNKVRLQISDTGIGIPENMFPDVFIPFHRLGRETSAIEGTGIGLAFCKEMVEKMGGSIGFTSQLDEGSSFWIEFEIVES